MSDQLCGRGSEMKPGLPPPARRLPDEGTPKAERLHFISDNRGCLWGILNLRQDPQDGFMLSMSSDTCEPRNLFSRLFEFDTQILKKKRLSFCL